MRQLNFQWRKKDQATDVLSFAAQEGQPMPGLEGILGDIFISVERAQIQALQFGHSLEEELDVLFVHGLTHLQGYDHERSEFEAARQVAAEMVLLESMGANPELALCGRRSRPLRMTPARELIRDALRSGGTHKTADQILDLVRKRKARVGQATVYRTLKLFQSEHWVRAHHFGNSEARFEWVDNPAEHHDHLICEECDQIVEFENLEIEVLQERVAKQKGFRLIHHRMELYGICGDCE